MTDIIMAGVVKRSETPNAKDRTMQAVETLHLGTGFKHSDYLVVRDKLIAADVTLDGKPARITGRLNSFATVSQCGDDWHIQAQFSWSTALMVVECGGGVFESQLHMAE